MRPVRAVLVKNTSSVTDVWSSAMAVGLEPATELAPVPGIRIGTIAAGIRRPGRLDLTLFELAPGSRTAAVFTRNQFCAAPVTVARHHLAGMPPRGLVINTGYANAGTGDAGEEDAVACCRAAAAALGCRAEEVLPFSTGIIGARLPNDRILAALPQAASVLAEDHWLDASRAIMTTDTVPKGISRVVRGGVMPVTITGIAKGSGMIEPNMATMLAFIATDADIPQALLQDLLKEVVAVTFNQITVDGDTSTNDACVLIATGRSGVPLKAILEPFRTALHAVCEGLAQALVRDAEGATKFVTVEVSGARTGDEARDVAYAIARSPLVKTALFAGDPNWGRMIAAAGRAAHKSLDTHAVSLRLNGVCVFRDGAMAPDYREEEGVAAMRLDEIHILLNLGAGRHGARVWTSDLSHEYVRINGEYRT